MNAFEYIFLIVVVRSLPLQVDVPFASDDATDKSGWPLIFTGRAYFTRRINHGCLADYATRKIGSRQMSIFKNCRYNISRILSYLPDPNHPLLLCLYFLSSVWEQAACATFGSQEGLVAARCKASVTPRDLGVFQCQPLRPVVRIRIQYPKFADLDASWL